MIPKRKPNSTYDYANVTVVLLLECCGQWQQKKMFELVRDSYYGSRLGVVIIGNSSLLQQDKEVPQWKEYLDHLIEEDAIKDHLELYCKKHAVINTEIYNGHDLQKKSNSGGCGKKCGELRCGHVCPHVCHPMDDNHTSEMFRCKQECKRRCSYGHTCKKFCWDDCGICFEIVKVEEPCRHVRQENIVYCHQQLLDPCLNPVMKILKCGHVAKLECSMSVKDYQCQKLVKGFLNCGHRFLYRCSEKAEDFQCEAPTTKEFECGHIIFLSCKEKLQNQTELKCGAMCNLKLRCGHECGRPCHPEDPEHEKIKCQELCNKCCSTGAHRCPSEGRHMCSEPCPPCLEEYEFPLECGHFFKQRCSDKEPDEFTYFCDQKCMREYAFCRHECKKLCGEECGRCNTVVDKIAVNCPRKHYVRVRCQEPVPDKCEWRVIPKARSDCGHKVLVYCHEADTLNNMGIAWHCEARCEARLDKENECGHLCRGTCKDCFQGRYHVRCEQPCGKMLICGHTCTSPCGMVCPPCRYACVNNCEHGNCEYECGVPCERKCQQPCSYTCEHSKCSKLCSEVCDKAICYEACKKILDCGHSCVGFCGEECPPFCRICSPKELLKGIFNGNTAVGPNDRFIYLKGCGHCVESEAMENWLLVKSDEILPKMCPVCRSRIPWIRRYSAIMNENMELINSVRTKIFGKIEDIEETKQLTIDMVEKFDKTHVFPEFVDFILSTADVPIKAPSELETSAQSMSLDRAKFLKMICQEWMSASEIVWEYHERLLPRHYDVFIKYWQEYLYDMIAERNWPLHPNEIGALKMERGRLEDVLVLYSRVMTNHSEESKLLSSSPLGCKMFKEAEDILQLCKPYSEKLKVKFRQHLSKLDGVLKCTIQLSDTERVEIVKAFGDGAGRWFKCQSGHVYVVTECGGTVEMGKCNECGGSIGGEDHMLVEMNYLATEMDGAEQPLYPTVLTRN